MKISELPEGLRQLAERRREEFEKNREVDDISYAFPWHNTEEKVKFWRTIDEGIFTPYYEKYGRPLRKIEDLGKDEAIHCSTKEEFDAIKDLYSGPGTIYDRWFESTKEETCIRPWRLGYCDKDHLKKNGYAIYPASDFINTKEKEMTKRYVLKEKYKDIEKSVRAVIGLHSEFSSIDFTEDSTVHTKAIKAGVMHWFEEKKDKFEVGDWVTIIDGSASNYHTGDSTFKVGYVSEGRTYEGSYVCETSSDRGNGVFFPRIRKATEQEIKEVTSYKVGDWVVVKSHRQAGQGNGVNTDNLVSELYEKGSRSASGILDHEADFIVNEKGIYYNIRKSHIIRKATPEEVIKAKEELEGVLPKINGYEGKIVGNPERLEYGCANLNVGWFKKSSSRHIKSMTLSSGVVISESDMDAIRKVLKKKGLI